MIRKSKSYKKPMKAFEAARIKEENELKKKYALKNKREIWKAQAKIDYYRGRAKALAKKPHEEQEVLFNKLKSLGLKVETIADVLGLKVEDILKRRLTTVVSEKKLADTPRQARQMVTHKKILINGRVVDSPSYLVPVSEENKIGVKKKVKKPKPAPVKEAPAEQPAETLEAPAESVDQPAREEPKVDEAPKEENTNDKKEETK